MQRFSRLGILVVAVFVGAHGAQAGKKKPVVTPTQVGPIVPKPNMYLRSGFDTDPSMFVGRFLPNGAANFDETGATKTSCSQLITWKKVGGGGVVYDEVYNASTAAAASFGIPLVAKVSGEAETGASVRVKYTLTNKMVADIADPAKFEECCKQASDQCTGLYIGEFIEGNGELYYASNQGSDFSAKGATTKLAGDVEVHNGVAWSKSIAFPNPVYFAFKTTANPYSGGVAAGCGDWVNGPPKSTQGQYFVGVSDPIQSERVARDQALLNARVQTVKWSAEAIKSGTVQATVISGSVGDLDAAVATEDTFEALSQGVATLVKDESWCVTSQGTPGGTVFTAKVLAFVPKERAADLANAALKAVKKP